MHQHALCAASSEMAAMKRRGVSIVSYRVREGAGMMAKYRQYHSV